MEELINAYVEKFNQNFPYFVVRGTEEEISEMIKKCLAEGKPLDPETDPDNDY